MKASRPLLRLDTSYAGVSVLNLGKDELRTPTPKQASAMTATSRLFFSELNFWACDKCGGVHTRRQYAEKCCSNVKHRSFFGSDLFCNRAFFSGAATIIIFIGITYPFWYVVYDFARNPAVFFTYGSSGAVSFKVFSLVASLFFVSWPLWELWKILRRISRSLTARIKNGVGLEKERALLVVQERLMGPDHVEILCLHNNIADTLLKLARPAEALREAETARQGYLSLSGRKPPILYYSARTNVAHALLLLGRLPEALVEAELAWEGCERVAGDEDPCTSEALEILQRIKAQLLAPSTFNRFDSFC